MTSMQKTSPVRPCEQGGMLTIQEQSTPTGDASWETSCHFLMPSLVVDSLHVLPTSSMITLKVTEVERKPHPTEHMNMI
ncbi:hypothetical protein Btru_044720 [Bulinus truncatus]|nr:hypothetical protein Btru_044720 [Bulinus truncatus]